MILKLSNFLSRNWGSMKKQLAVCTIVMLGAIAAAQDSSTPISLRLGVGFPTRGSTRDVSKEFYGIGVQRKISSINSTGQYDNELALSLDYYGRGDFRHIPILLNYVGTSKGGNTFYSVGAGFGFIKRPIVGGTESIGRLAYQASVGLNLTSGATASFIELKYFGSELSELNTVGLYYGVRF
jgi:hypothetical protein